MQFTQYINNFINSKSAYSTPILSSIQENYRCQSYNFSQIFQLHTGNITQLEISESLSHDAPENEHIIHLVRII